MNWYGGKWKNGQNVNQKICPQITESNVFGLQHNFISFLIYVTSEENHNEIHNIKRSEYRMSNLMMRIK